MARTWNVEVEDSFAEVAGKKPEPVEPGGTTQVARFNKREKDGSVRFGGLMFKCPICGTAGSCASIEATSPDEPSWDIRGVEEGRVTMFPSIDCKSSARTDGPDGRCPGHYWLTDGVLTEA